MIKFEKVSFEEYYDAFPYKNGVEMDEVYQIWEHIQLPKRSTKYAAGYDFFLPYNIELKPGQSSGKIPFGIRAVIDTKLSYEGDWFMLGCKVGGIVLKLYPRSSLGRDFKMRFDNTVPVIDQDYWTAKNEGHIMAYITNCSSDAMYSGKLGDKICQGIFEMFFVTDDDEVKDERIGGFGSTGK